MTNGTPTFDLFDLRGASGRAAVSHGRGMAMHSMEHDRSAAIAAVR